MTQRNKVGRKWAIFQQKQRRADPGGEHMVKGVSKRIIEIPSPDPKVFEKAYFIVREDYVGQTGVSEKDILRQARQAAALYSRSGRLGAGPFWERLRPVLYAVAGAAVTALTWLTLHFTLPIG